VWSARRGRSGTRRSAGPTRPHRRGRRDKLQDGGHVRPGPGFGPAQGPATDADLRGGLLDRLRRSPVGDLLITIGTRPVAPRRLSFNLLDRCDVRLVLQCRERSLTWVQMPPLDVLRHNEVGDHVLGVALRQRREDEINLCGFARPIAVPTIDQHGSVVREDDRPACRRDGRQPRPAARRRRPACGGPRRGRRPRAERSSEMSTRSFARRSSRSMVTRSALRGD
jgi:hypothetical protein